MMACLDNEPANFGSIFRDILDKKRQSIVASKLCKARGERGFEKVSSTFSNSGWGEKILVSS